MWMWGCTIAYKYEWEGENACEFMPVNTFSKGLLLPVYVCENVSMCEWICVCVFVEH